MMVVKNETKNKKIKSKEEKILFEWKHRPYENWENGFGYRVYIDANEVRLCRFTDCCCANVWDDIGFEERTRRRRIRRR